MAPRKFLLACLGAAIFLGASPAAAQSSNGKIAPKASYEIAPYTGLMRLDLPSYNPIMLQQQDFSVIRFMEHDTGKMNVMANGVELQKRVSFGDRFAATLGGFLGARTGSNKTESLFDETAAVRIGWYPMDGAAGGRTGFNFGDDVLAASTRDVDMVDAGLFLKHDIDRFPGFGLSYGARYLRLNQEFSLAAYEVQTPANRLTQDEKLKAEYVGPQLQVSYQTDILPLVDLDLGLASSALYMKARYSGIQASDGPTIPIYNAAQSDRHTDIAVLSEIRGAVTYKRPDYKIRLGLEAAHFYNVPGIQQSTAAPLATGGRPAHIKMKNAYSVGGRVSLIIPF